MKKTTEAMGMALLTLGLIACSVQGSSSLPLESEDISSSSPSLFSSTEEDPPEKRIHSLEFSILDLSKTAVSEEDPRFLEESKSAESYRKSRKLTMYYLDEIDDVYYVSLEDFANLFRGEFVYGATSQFSESEGVSTWSLLHDGEVLYRMALDTLSKKMSIDGASMDVAIVKGIDTGENGLGRYCASSTEYVPSFPAQTAVYSFKEYDFEVFEADGHYRYPFALLMAELSKVCDRNFLFLTANREIIEYGSRKQIELARFRKADGNEIPVTSYIQKAFDKQYGSGVEGEYPVEPLSLRTFNRNLFYYIMDHYYGIADEKGIVSMRSYLLPFEYAVSEDKGFSHVVMNSFNRIGVIWAGADSNLQLNILQNEWGFQGYTITDMAQSDGALYMLLNDGFAGGTNLFMKSASSDDLKAMDGWKDNAYFANMVRDSAKRIIYTITNYSVNMVPGKITSVTPWWSTLLTTLTIVSGILMGGSLAMAAFCIFKSLKQQ